MQLKARCKSMVEVQSQIPAILAGCNCTTIPCFASPAAKICTCFSYFVASLLHDFCRQVNRRGKATRNHGFQNRHHENQQTSLTKDSFTCCAGNAQAIDEGSLGLLLHVHFRSRRRNQTARGLRIS